MNDDFANYVGLRRTGRKFARVLPARNKATWLIALYVREAIA